MDTEQGRDSDPQVLRRLHLALTADKDELFRLVDDSSPEVLRTLLKNPRLDGNHLLALLKRRDLTEDFLRQLARTPLVEESHLLKVAMVKNPATPAPLILSLIPHLHLFELLSICWMPGVTADQKLAAERAIIQRLPTTPLGNKIALARRGTAAVVEAVLSEGQPACLDACLNNPQLKEATIFRFLSGPRSTAETISVVARHPKWQSRPNLRLAILKNRLTPVVWYHLFLPGLPVTEIRNLRALQRLTPAQRRAVEEEGKRRGI
jgi:hypothetical protein